MTAPAGRGIFGDAVTTLISLAGVPGSFTAAYLIEAWGRKPACVAALVGAAVSAWFYGTAANEARLFAWASRCNSANSGLRVHLRLRHGGA